MCFKSTAPFIIMFHFHSLLQLSHTFRQSETSIGVCTHNPDFLHSQGQCLECFTRVGCVRKMKLSGLRSCSLLAALD